MHEELLAKHGIAQFQDAIFALRKECLAGHPVAEGGEGTSWLGGLPRVDAGFAWPIKDGRPLDFVAQLRCVDVGISARGGYLLFFYDQQHHGFAPEDEGGFVCMHQNGERQLTAADLPVGHAPMLFGLFDHQVKPTVWKRKGLTFEKTYSYPANEARDVLEAAASKFEGAFWDCYFEFLEEVDHKIQVGGIASPVNDDEPHVRALCAEMVDAKPEECVLLLQLHSIDDMLWGDVGSLCWYLPAEDLARGDFTRVWMVMTCG